MPSCATPRSSSTVTAASSAARSGTEKLPIAAAGNLAEAMGGYLGVEDAPTTCLSLILPVSRAHVRA